MHFYIFVYGTENTHISQKKFLYPLLSFPPIEYFYNRGSGYKLQNDSIIRTGDDEIYEAPTQALVAKWLRETHNILVEVNFRNFAAKGTEGYFYMCGTKNEFWTMNNYFGETLFKGYETYEAALEAGLVEGLKLIEEK